ncbi:MAG: hypothetical protein U0271_09160 [Polyangiaceae bacterium]
MNSRIGGSRYWVIAAAWFVGCSPSRGPEAGPDSQPSATSSVEARASASAPGATTSSASNTASAPIPSASQAASTALAETPPPNFSAIPEKRKGAFPGVPFKKVRAFAFDLEVNGRPVCSMPLDPDGTLCSTVARPGVELSAEQTKSLLALLKQSSTYGGGSKCFLPHHGFVFYAEDDTPVAEISLCFMCEMILPLPAISGATPSGEGEGLVGLSEKGTKSLRKLCSELGLPKCDARTPDDYSGGLLDPP